MLNKSLFICYSTPNYSDLTSIFLNSLHDIKVNNINHMIDNIVNLPGESGFQTDFWHNCVRNKINHLINVLRDHDNLKNIKYFIFTDCDVIYIKKNVQKWHELENYIRIKKKNIYFIREGNDCRCLTESSRGDCKIHDANTGFFIIVNNNNTKNIINFFVKVLQTMDVTEKTKMPFGDQTIINKLKNKINYGFIPNDFVVFGDRIYNSNKSLFHHSVGCTNKIAQINEVKLALIESPLWPPASNKML